MQAYPGVYSNGLSHKTSCTCEAHHQHQLNILQNMSSLGVTLSLISYSVISPRHLLKSFPIPLYTKLHTSNLRSPTLPAVARILSPNLCCFCMLLKPFDIIFRYLIHRYTIHLKFLLTLSHCITSFSQPIVAVNLNSQHLHYFHIPNSLSSFFSYPTLVEPRTSYINDLSCP